MLLIKFNSYLDRQIRKNMTTLLSRSFHDFQSGVFNE